MELLSVADLHTIYLFVFSIGIGLGLGATILWNLLVFFASNDDRISRDEFGILKKTRVVIWVAIFLHSFGGLGLFTLAYESMLSLGIFYASMNIATLLIISELIFSFRNIPRLEKHPQGYNSTLGAFFLIGGSVSISSWIFLTIHHMLYRTDVNYFLFMALYFVVIGGGIFVAYIARKDSLDKRSHTMLKRAFAVVLLLAFSMGTAYAVNIKFFNEIEDKVEISKTTKIEKNYTVENIATHNNSEDCWLIIDGLVFDATEASRLHPALFHCGGDSSVNYHKNHGKDISEKMMQFYIGELGGEMTSKEDVVEEKTTSYAVLNPTKELYVKEGSWDAKELMVVVEKSAEKLLFIDGKTHEEIGRIHDVGFQPHTSVFSSDLKYMYIISRDGWLSKIDVSTLDPVGSVRVGDNSRGTALTKNNKFVAIGNYEPHNIVILDAIKMEIVETIKVEGEISGEIIGSRVGALVESGNDFIAAMKDLSSVWVVGQDTEGKWVVKNKYWNIGGNKTPLHDGYLTPGGGFFIVAAQGADSVWVLDTTEWKEVGEVKTGKLPHTGPGATWGTTTYIPALEEGLITAIDTTTWKPIASIKTGGPGLFVRSYHKDHDYHYVWADTAFGDKKDEIYVIDAKVNKVIKTLIPVKGKSSWHPEFTYDGLFVYVVSQEGGEVVVYDSNTFEVVKRIKSDTPSAVSNVGLRTEEVGL